MKRMLSLICSVVMLLSLFSVAYAIAIEDDINLVQEQCDHYYEAKPTGDDRYMWYKRSEHKYYLIYQEVCIYCGHLYRETYAEKGTYSHTVGNTYCSGGEHVTPGKHTFYKKCTVCYGECSESITVTCPGDNGYAHVSPP